MILRRCFPLLLTAMLAGCALRAASPYKPFSIHWEKDGPQFELQGRQYNNTPFQGTLWQDEAETTMTVVSNYTWVLWFLQDRNSTSGIPMYGTAVAGITNAVSFAVPSNTLSRSFSGWYAAILGTDGAGRQYSAEGRASVLKSPETSPPSSLIDSNVWQGALNNLPMLGDVTGIVKSNTVVKIRNVAVSATAPTNGQALVSDGSQWRPLSVVLAESDPYALLRTGGTMAGDIDMDANEINNLFALDMMYILGLDPPWFGTITNCYRVYFPGGSSYVGASSYLAILETGELQAPSIRGSSLGSDIVVHNNFNMGGNTASNGFFIGDGSGLTGIVSTGGWSSAWGNTNNWNTAFGWGDHATNGYRTTDSNAIVTAGSGGITVVPITNGTVITYTVSDDDAGGGGNPVDSRAVTGNVDFADAYSATGLDRIVFGGSSVASPDANHPQLDANETEMFIYASANVSFSDGSGNGPTAVTIDDAYLSGDGANSITNWAAVHATGFYSALSCIGDYRLRTDISDVWTWVSAAGDPLLYMGGQDSADDAQIVLRAGSSGGGGYGWLYKEGTVTNAWSLDYPRGAGSEFPHLELYYYDGAAEWTTYPYGLFAFETNGNFRATSFEGDGSALSNITATTLSPPVTITGSAGTNCVMRHVLLSETNYIAYTMTGSAITNLYPVLIAGQTP